MIPAEQHYEEYLEDVADQCSEDVEEITEDGKYIIYRYDY